MVLNEGADLIKMTDGPLIRFAVFELGLKIIGRSRWAIKCPGCHYLVAKEDWNRHRCK